MIPAIVPTLQAVQFFKAPDVVLGADEGDALDAVDLESHPSLVRRRALLAASYFLAAQNPGRYVLSESSPEDGMILWQLFDRISTRPLTSLIPVKRRGVWTWTPALDEVSFDWMPVSVVVRVREFTGLLLAAFHPKNWKRW